MSSLSDHHYLLPTSLREELGKPQGILIEGNIEDTTKVLKQKLMPHDFLLVAVGDVTAEIFVDNGFQPDIVVTDGLTKREELDEWREFGFKILQANCPAAEITSEAWKVLQKAVKLAEIEPIHVKIIGEEDLLVLPLLVELPNGSKIVYGQPNTGAVIRTVTDQTRNDAIDIIKRMNKKD